MNAKELRQLTGLNQTKIAKVLGISQQAWSKIESGATGGGQLIFDASHICYGFDIEQMAKLCRRASALDKTVGESLRETWLTFGSTKRSLTQDLTRTFLTPAFAA